MANLDVTGRSKRGSSPPASSDAARNRMVAAKQRDTKPELELRAFLENAGLEFEVDTPPILGLRRRADILFSHAYIAVFIDGCFWHGCPIHGTWPKKNAEFWRDKIETNRQRDKDTDQRLKEKGWQVVRAWEHDDMKEVALIILRLVGNNI